MQPRKPTKCLAEQKLKDAKLEQKLARNELSEEERESMSAAVMMKDGEKVADAQAQLSTGHAGFGNSE